MEIKDIFIVRPTDNEQKEFIITMGKHLATKKKLLDEGLDINKDGDIIKVKKEWNENILADGGISYYKLNDKWYRVSVVGDNNDIILKFRFKDAMGRWVSVSAKSIQQAQSVVDDIFGKGKYIVSSGKV